MKFKIYFFSALFLLVACNTSNESSEDDTQTQSEAQLPEITVRDIEALKYDDYVLSDASSQATSNWQKFQELSSQVEFLKKADLSFFKSEKQTLLSLMTDLKNEIPEVINTNPVSSRILVLETKLLKLQNSLTISNISKEEKLQDIMDLLIAFSNLNLHINKKLEFDANDVERPE